MNLSRAGSNLDALVSAMIEVAVNAIANPGESVPTEALPLERKAANSSRLPKPDSCFTTTLGHRDPLKACLLTSRRKKHVNDRDERITPGWKPRDLFLLFTEVPLKRGRLPLQISSGLSRIEDTDDR